MYYLAIDIGKIHLGYCIYCPGMLIHGLYNISEQFTPKQENEYGLTICRIKSTIKWLKDLLNKYQDIERIIVEKQVISNVVAKSIEASILAIAEYNGIIASTYDPKNKFKYLNEHYSSKKKEHKQIAIRYARNILLHNMITDDELDQYSKKDDVSDAICMAFMSWIEEHCKSRNKKQHGYVNKQESNIDATLFIRRYISSMQIYNTLFTKRYGNISK